MDIVNNSVKSSLRYKISFAFAVGIIVLLAVGIMSYQSIIHYEENNQDVKNTQLLIDKIENLSGNLYRMIAIQRGFNISGTRVFKDAYEERKKEIPAQVEEIRTLTAGNNEQMKNLALLDSIIKVVIVRNDSIIYLREKVSFQAAADLQQKTTDDRVIAQMVDTKELMKKEAYRVMDIRLQEEARSSSDTKIAIIAGSIFAILFTFLALFIIIKDIDARVEAETGLRKSEELYKTLLDNLPDETVTIYDRSLKYLLVGGGGFRKIEFDAKALEGKNISDIMTPEAYERFKPYYSGVFDGKILTMEYELRNRVLEIIFLPVYDEERKIIENGMVLTHDITERKIADEEIRKSETALTEAQSIAHIGSWEWDVQQNKLFWSEELYRIFGLDPEKDKIDYELYVSLLHPDDRKMLTSIIEKAYKTGEPYITEHRIIRPDKSVRTLQGQGRVKIDKDGIPVRMFGIARDITEIKLAEEQLREANKKLLHNEKLAALGRFSSHISHEIRNPLANISASAQLILSKFKPEPPLSTYLDIIMRNSKTASRIIKELLDFASPRELKLEEGDVADVISEVCELISPRCQQHNINLSCDCKDVDGNIVKLNHEKLQEALMNFVSNSIDAMPNGGDLSIVMHNHDPYIHILVKDSGYGIPPENMEKIFEPFFTTKDTGTGLGVALAHQIVIQHQGKLEVTSEVGIGTTIEIKIPIKGEQI